MNNNQNSTNHQNFKKNKFEDFKNLKIPDGSIQLHNAAIRGNLQLVKYMVLNGANVDITNNKNYTPLSFSSMKGHLEIVKFLVSQGANIEHKTSIGLTPLLYELFIGI